MRCCVLVALASGAGTLRTAIARGRDAGAHEASRATQDGPIGPFDISNAPHAQYSRLMLPRTLQPRVEGCEMRADVAAPFLVIEGAGAKVGEPEGEPRVLALLSADRTAVNVTVTGRLNQWSSKKKVPVAGYLC